MALTSLSKPVILFFFSPFTKSQILTTSSAPALASVRSFRFQLTRSTWCVCPSNCFTTLPVANSTSLTNLSAAPEARYFPSGEKSRANTASLCTLVKDRINLPVATCQSLISPQPVGAPPPVPSSLPSGLNFTTLTRSSSVELTSPDPITRSNFHSRCKFQTLTARSAVPQTRLPSLANATASTAPL